MKAHDWAPMQSFRRRLSVELPSALPSRLRCVGARYNRRHCHERSICGLVQPYDGIPRRWCCRCGARPWARTQRVCASILRDVHDHAVCSRPVLSALGQHVCGLACVCIGIKRMFVVYDYHKHLIMLHDREPSASSRWLNAHRLRYEHRSAHTWQLPTA